MRKYVSQIEGDRTGSRAPEKLTNAQVEAPARGGDVLQMQRMIGNQQTQRVLGVRSVRARPPEEREPSEGGRTGLPSGLQAAVERLSGESMADVNVHYNSSKPARISALAYTQGSEIYMGPGQERYLAHEAWHAAQQKQGRVSSTKQAGGQPVNNEMALEREADMMGQRAARLLPEPGSKASKSSGRQTPGRVVQAARGPGPGVIQMLSATREPRNGMQIKLETQHWAREWELSAWDKDGEGTKVSWISLKLVTKFAGKKPKLSVDTMQSKGGSKGAGGELLGSIPWAINLVISKNPLATRFGHVQVHSGFANIVAFQMAVKKYAEALELRGSDLWSSKFLEGTEAAQSVDTSEDDVEDVLVPKSSKGPPKQKYDFSRFGELWADTLTLMETGLLHIDVGRLDLSNAEKSVKNIVKLGSKVFGAFMASIDVMDASELAGEIEAVKAEVKRKLALEVDEKVIIEETAL